MTKMDSKISRMGKEREAVETSELLTCELKVHII
jgi:hypothetical protein